MFSPRRLIPQFLIPFTILCALLIGSLTKGRFSNEPTKISGVSDWYRYLYSTDAVTMDMFDTTYYDLDEEGAKNWEHILPPGGNAHLIQLNTEDEGTPANYTIALFHQLKCLEIYYREYSLDASHKPSPLLRHCLNYLRQQIMCQLDTKLESVRTKKAQSARFYTSVCRDWTKVYEAASLVSPNI